MGSFAFQETTSVQTGAILDHKAWQEELLRLIVSVLHAALL
jgi:hypothetical protein